MDIFTLLTVLLPLGLMVGLMWWILHGWECFPGVRIVGLFKPKIVITIAPNKEEGKEEEEAL